MHYLAAIIIAQQNLAAYAAGACAVAPEKKEPPKDTTVDLYEQYLRKRERHQLMIPRQQEGER